MEKIKQLKKLVQDTRDTLSELKDRRDPMTGQAFTTSFEGERSANGVKDWFIDEVEKIVNEQ